MGSVMYKMHDKIHLVIAVAFLGYFSMELNMLTMQSSNVNNSPILPGIASMGMTKLICKSEHIIA